MIGERTESSAQLDIPVFESKRFILAQTTQNTKKKVKSAKSKPNETRTGKDLPL